MAIIPTRSNATVSYYDSLKNSTVLVINTKFDLVHPSNEPFEDSALPPKETPGPHQNRRRLKINLHFFPTVSDYSPQASNRIIA